MKSVSKLTLRGLERADAMIGQSILFQRANEVILEKIAYIFPPEKQNEEEAYGVLSDIMNVASKMIEKGASPKYNEYTYTALTNAISEIFSIVNKEKQIYDLDQITISNIEMIVSSLFEVVQLGSKKRINKNNIFAITERIFSNIKIDDPKAKNELKIIRNSYSYVTHSTEDSDIGVISEERFNKENLDFETIFSFIEASEKEEENSDSEAQSFINIMPDIFPDFHNLYVQFIFDSFLYAYFVIHTIIFFRNRLRFIEEKGLDKMRVFLDLQKVIANKVLYFYDNKLAELDGNYAKASVWLRSVFSLSTYAPHEGRSKQANIRVTARQFFASLGIPQASAAHRTVEGKILITRVKALEAKIIYHMQRSSDTHTNTFNNSIYTFIEDTYHRKITSKEIESNIAFLNSMNKNNIFYRIGSSIMPYFKGRMDLLWNHILDKVDCPHFVEAISHMDFEVKCIYGIIVIYVAPVLMTYKERAKNLPDILATFMCNKLIRKK